MATGTLAGTETVLIAGDDPLLLPLARELLRTLVSDVVVLARKVREVLDTK